MSTKILFLSAADVDRALSMTTAITAVREAFIDLSRGDADVPLRTPIALAGDGTALFMPVHLPRLKQSRHQGGDGRSREQGARSADDPGAGGGLRLSDGPPAGGDGR